MHEVEAAMPIIPETGDRTTSRPRRPQVAFFGHDCTETAVIERARAFRAAGLEVVGFTFRGRRLDRDHAPEWNDVSLGETIERHGVLRPIRLVRAAARLVRERRALASADFLYARSIDMCALALFARAIARSRAPVVYEVVDVPRVLTGSGPLPFLLRLAERLILARIALLVVSSRAMIGRYFAPVQGYAWPWFLLEDKVPGGDEATPEQPFLPEGDIAELSRRVLGARRGAAEAGPADIVAAVRWAGL